MKEIYGDLFEEAPNYDAICITTNGFIGSRGRAIMGRGCALEAKKRWPGIDGVIGGMIETYGNIPKVIIQHIPDGGYPFSDVPCNIVSFPVKHNWWEKADLDLIKESAMKLVEKADRWKWEKVLLPRPGCGNGKLDWETEVKPVLEEILDNRFYVITWKGDERGNDIPISQ